MIYHSSLEKDKAILDSLIHKLKDSLEAAKMVSNQMEVGKREAEEERMRMEEKAKVEIRRLRERIGVLDYRNERQSDRLYQMDHLMLRYAGHGVSP